MRAYSHTTEAETENTYMNKMATHSKSLVIINADDFGITKGTNKAIFELAGIGVITSTTVMTNMPYYEEITSLHNKIGIGIHFNLSIGKPANEASRVSSLVTEDGKFHDISALIYRMKKKRIVKSEVLIELDAQIKRLINAGITIDHMDSHESILKYPFFVNIMMELAQKYRIPAVRTYSPRKFDYRRLMSPKRILISLYLAFQKFQWKRRGFKVADKYEGLIMMGLDYSAAINKLEDIFKQLPEGVLEIGVHPGYCSDDLAPLGEYLYEREAELEALKSDRFTSILRQTDVELVTFSDI